MYIVCRIAILSVETESSLPLEAFGHPRYSHCPASCTPARQAPQPLSHNIIVRNRFAKNAAMLLAVRSMLDENMTH